MLIIILTKRNFSFNSSKFEDVKIQKDLKQYNIKF
jgi:hypothetical protein